MNRSRDLDTPEARFEALYADHYRRVLGYVLRRAPAAVAPDNVYVADDLPTVPEAQIVARGASGNAVWHEAFTPQSDTHATTCGLG